MGASDNTQAADTEAAVVSAEKFLTYLADSGLVTAEEVNPALAEIEPAQRQDARQLAQELVRRGTLTRYQASMLLQGKVKGLVLGSYAILAKLGQGGMGMVFQARHRLLGRIVALKVLP